MGLTQTALSAASGVHQSLISQLEASETATGSEYTPRLARAMRISVDWLADEIGEMVPLTYATTDPKIIAVAGCMEAMPEYAKDAAVEDVAKVAKLIAQTREGTND
jgi:transcriptional regulator with XRE-family HTH domain